MRFGRSAAASAVARRLGIGTAILVTVLTVGIRGTQDAIANGDTRTLTLYHNNTKETLTVTFRRNGQYDSNALDQLNWFLRDWRRSEPTKMDPRLFDTVWEVYREVRASEPIQVNSGYRSPNTNAMLRRRSSAVAKNSQHMLGKAMDFYISDASTTQLRAIGMRLQNGGVGYYPNAYTPFIHLDVGSVRSWPRMTRDQLSRLFPDGRTVHIPSDGRPLERYEEARAEVLAKGGSVAGYSMVADAEEASQPRRKSFWATLFGGSDEDEDVEEIRAASRPGRNLFATRGSGQRNPYAGDADSPTAVLQAYNESRNPQPAARAAAVATPPAPAPIPAPEPLPARTTVAAAPPPAAFRDDLVPPPQPPTRIAGLPGTVATPAGPVLAWQQGPVGQGGSDLRIGRGADLAPLPPRRPDGGEDVGVTGAIAYAPMPPARPGALTSSLSGSLPGSLPGSLAASNPIPVLSGLRPPTQTASLGGLDHPLPPPRPGFGPPARTTSRAVTVASAGPIDIAEPAAAPAPGAVKAQGAKAPGSKNADAKSADAKSADSKNTDGKSANTRSADSTKAGIAARKTAVAASVTAGSKAAASTTPGRAVSGGPSVLTAAGSGLTMGFSSKPMGDLSTSRFTGPAVKPLATR